LTVKNELLRIKNSEWVSQEEAREHVKIEICLNWKVEEKTIEKKWVIKDEKGFDLKEIKVIVGKQIRKRA
jgi:hypothetical protein